MLGGDEGGGEDWGGDGEGEGNDDGGGEEGGDDSSKKKVRKEAADGPNAPKKPPSVLDLYAKAVRPQILKDNPSLRRRKISQRKISEVPRDANFE